MEKFHPIKLKTVSNEIEAELIVNLLRDNDIPCFTKNKGLDGYLHIVMGYAAFEEDIYIDKRDYLRALDLLNSLNYYEEPASIEDIETDEKPPFYRNSRVMMRIYFIGIIAFLLLTFFLTNHG